MVVAVTFPFFERDSSRLADDPSLGWRLGFVAGIGCFGVGLVVVVVIAVEAYL